MAVERKSEMVVCWKEAPRAPRFVFQSVPPGVDCYRCAWRSLAVGVAGSVLQFFPRGVIQEGHQGVHSELSIFDDMTPESLETELRQSFLKSSVRASLRRVRDWSGGAVWSSNQAHSFQENDSVPWLAK